MYESTFVSGSIRPWAARSDLSASLDSSVKRGMSQRYGMRTTVATRSAAPMASTSLLARVRSAAIERDNRCRGGMSGPELASIGFQLNKDFEVSPRPSSLRQELIHLVLLCPFSACYVAS